MSDERRFLIVGAGVVGGNFARMLAAGEVPGGALASIVDIDGTKALELASDTGTHAYGDTARAVAESKPDAALIATPDGLHREPVEALARAGVPMLIDKPLATTIEDATAIIEAVKAAGVYAEVNYTHRWDPPFQAAMHAIEAGEIGDVCSFNARMNNPLGASRDRLRWRGATTPAWFLMSHCLDLALWFGKRRALSVYASGGRGVLAGERVDTYDWVHATVRYAGGGDGVFESNWILPESWPGASELNVRIAGTTGLIDVDATGHGVAVAAARHRYPAPASSGAQRLAAFLRALDGQGRTRVPLEDGLEVTRILVAIHRSLETGAVETV